MKQITKKEFYTKKIVIDLRPFKDLADCYTDTFTVEEDDYFKCYVSDDYDKSIKANPKEFISYSYRGSQIDTLDVYIYEAVLIKLNKYKVTKHLALEMGEIFEFLFKNFENLLIDKQLEKMR